MSYMKGCWFDSCQRHNSYLPAVVTPCGTGAADGSYVAFKLTLKSGVKNRDAEMQLPLPLWTWP